MNWTLVTGGAKRVGAAICRTLAQEGYDILVHYNTSEDEANQVVNFCRDCGVRAEKIQGDFTTLESTQQFVHTVLEDYSSIKNLINNVGNYLVASALKTPVDEWYTLFQTNLHTPFVLIKALIPSIQISKGSIINIGVPGLDAGRADTYCSVYTTTKLGLLMLTRSLAKELASSGVRVNMVSPGQLDISMDAPRDPSQLPMKRVGTTEEVARVVAFLLDERNSYITGQNIEVAGALRL